MPPAPNPVLDVLEEEGTSLFCKPVYIPQNIKKVGMDFNNGLQTIFKISF